MEKTKEIISISESTRKNIEYLEAFKYQVDEISSKCLLIQISDDITLAIGQQNLAKANTMLKAVQDKVKVIRKPLNDELKQISAIGNPIEESLEKAVNYLKNQVAAFEKARLAQAAAEQAEIDKRLEYKRKADEAEEQRKADIRTYITQKATPLLKSMYDKCTTVAICDLNIAGIEKGYKSREFFQEFADEAYELKQTYLDLITAKRKQLESADTMSESEKEISLQKEAIALEKANLAAREAAVKASEDAAKAAKEKADSELAAQLEKDRLAAEAELNKTKGVRFNWKFELVDKTKLPQEWITIDEAAIKEHIKLKKDGLQEGVVNGVRFYKNMSIVS